MRPAALEDGQTYKLIFPRSCVPPRGNDDAGVVIPKASLPSTYAYLDVIAVSFQAGPSAPLPESLGTVSVSTSAQVVQAGSYCGSCTAPLAAAVAQLQFTPSAQLRPFLPVTRLEVLVDGQRWAESAYGSGFVEETAYPGGPVRSVHTVFASCGTEDTSIYDPGVGAGRRVIEVRAHVAGASVEPAPVFVEVDLDCAPWASLDRPAGTCGFAEPDAGRSDGADGGTGTEPPSGGCSGSGWFGVGALLGVAVFRQRRGAL